MRTENSFRQEFVASKTAIPLVHDFVRSALEQLGVHGKAQEDFILACDEAASNIVEHAFHGKNPNAPRYFRLLLRRRHNCVVAIFVDNGRSFNIEKVEPPDIERNLRGEKRGGYGIFLIRRLVDKMVYSARRGLNFTKLVKQVVG